MFDALGHFTRSLTHSLIASHRIASQPSSTFRWYWETLNFVLYTTNSFLIPSRVLFGSRGSKESIYIQTVAIAIQGIFFMDLVLRSVAFAYEEQVRGWLRGESKKARAETTKRPTATTRRYHRSNAMNNRRRGSSSPRHTRSSLGTGIRGCCGT